MRSSRLRIVLAATVLVTGGYMATFSYVSPLLADEAGLSAATVPLVLVGFGIGLLLASNLAGRFADRQPLTTFTVATTAAAIIMLLIVLLSSNASAAVVLVVLLGVAGMAVPTVATGLVVRFGASAPTFAAGLAVSGFNGGIASGSWIAGHTLDSAFGVTGPAVVGAVMATAGLLPLLALAAMRASSQRDVPGAAGAPVAPGNRTTRRAR